MGSYRFLSYHAPEYGAFSHRYGIDQSTKYIVVFWDWKIIMMTWQLLFAKLMKRFSSFNLFMLIYIIFLNIFMLIFFTRQDNVIKDHSTSSVISLKCHPTELSLRSLVSCLPLLSVSDQWFFIRWLFVSSSWVWKCLSRPKLKGIVWTMKSSPTRKYENFSNDHQGKETDKYSLDSQDTASVVSSLLKLLILFVYCIRCYWFLGY